MQTGTRRERVRVPAIRTRINPVPLTRCNKGVALMKLKKNIWATRPFDKAIAF
jgi:hypothetical protein